MEDAIGDRDITPGGDLPRHRRRRSRGRGAHGSRDHAPDRLQIARPRRQRRAHRAGRRRRRRAGHRDHRRAPDRSSTAATRDRRRRAPAGGATSSATRGAATGSAAKRSPRSCARWTAGDPQTRLGEDVLAFFNIDDTSRLPRIVYDRELPRMSVAALGPIVQRASELGDAVATAFSNAPPTSWCSRRGRSRRGSRCAATSSRSCSPAASSTSSRRSARRWRAGWPRWRPQPVRLLEEEPAIGAVSLALAEARGGASDSEIQVTCASRSAPHLGRRRARSPAASHARWATTRASCWGCRPAGRRSRSISSWPRYAGPGDVDFSRASTFNLDEFLGLAAGHPASYRTFMQRHLFDHVNLPARRIQFLNGATPDAAAECARYERAIDRAGGIDLQILGLGTNGHIGFNEPGTRWSPERTGPRSAMRRGARIPDCSVDTPAPCRAKG